MDPMVSAQGEQLRAAADDLRDDVVQDLLMAREKISDDAGHDVFGPTVAPAAQGFLEAWRSELTAVVDAVGELARSLDAAAFAYDLADQQASDSLQSTL
jgi:Excreted virulence factor EspC, type VII ESX diderm